MKLIVNISEEAKRRIDTYKGKFLVGDGFDLIEAIQNGIPLDDVKAEITEAYANTHGMYPNYASGLSHAYKIIDECIIRQEVRKYDSKGTD